MILQINSALKDIKRNLLSIIFFAIQLTIFIIFTVIVLGGLMSSVDYYKNYQKIDRYKLTGFKTYYTNNVDDKNSTKKNTYAIIEKCFDENKALSFVDSIRINGHSDINVIVGIGMFGQVYDYSYNNDIKVLIGSKITELKVGDGFEFGGIKKLNLIVSGHLSKTSSFFRQNSLSSLDNSILILMPYSDFSSLYDAESNYKTIFKSNINLIDVNQSEVGKVTKEINNSSNIRVVPINYNDYIMKQSNQLKDNITFFIIAIIGAFAFVSISIINNLLTLVDNNLTEYSINLLYGATMSQMFMRMFFYVFIMVAPSYFLAFNFLNKVGLVKGISIIIQCFVTITISVIISSIPFYKLRKRNMLYFLRRDF